MNLTLHLVRSDLVRMRAWIACWIGVLLLPLVIGATFLARNPLADEEWQLPNTLAILAGLQVVVGYILTILLVHEHRIVGTQQFWLTRPISRGRLLRAKAIGALVIVGLLPVAMSLPWWLWCGFGAGQIASAAAETIMVMMLAAVPAALMAVLTDSFPRALLWTLVLVATVLFAMLFFSIVNARIVRTSHENSLAVARSIVAIVAVVVEMAAIVAVQFFVRRRGWWLGLAGALMVISLVASMRWPWPWVSEIPHERNVERAADVIVRFDGATAYNVPPRAERYSGQEVFQRVGTRFFANGIPPGMVLSAVDALQTWRWKNGMRIARSEYFYGGTDPLAALGLRRPPADPETRRWLAENDEKFKALVGKARPPGEIVVEASAWIQPSIVARMQAEPPEYQAHLWWNLWRPEFRFEIPLVPGRWVTRDSHGLRIDSVRHEAGQTVAVLVETQPVLIRIILHEMASARWSFTSDISPGGGLLAINRKRGEVVDFFDESRSPKPRAVIVNGVVIQWRGVTGSAGRVMHEVIRDGKWVAQPDWMDGSTLGILAGREQAIFTRDIKVERFEVTPTK